MVERHNKSLQGLLDKHAPEKIKIVRIRENQHWYTEHIRWEKLQRRKLERRWRKTGENCNYIAFKEKRNHVNNLMCETKNSIIHP